jgi:hypothetical protein
MKMDETLTERMASGLRRMAKKLERQESVMSEPNDNTAQALVRRGLLEPAAPVGGWRRYRLTDAGRKWLESNP